MSSPPDDYLQSLLECLAHDDCVVADANFKRRLVATLQERQFAPTGWERLCSLWQKPNSWLRWGWRAAWAMLLVWGTWFFLLYSPQVELTVAQGPIEVTNSSGRFVSWQEPQSVQQVETQQTVPLQSGSRIALPESGAAVLNLFHSSYVELSAGTTMTLTEVTPGTLWQSAAVQMQVTSGEMRAHVAKLRGPQERFEVTLPSAHVSVRGTVFRVRVISKTHTYVATDEGVVRVALRDSTQPDMAIDVPAGYEVHAIVGQLLLLQQQSPEDLLTYAVSASSEAQVTPSLAPDAPLVSPSPLDSALYGTATPLPSLTPAFTAVATVFPTPNLSSTVTPSPTVGIEQPASPVSALEQASESQADADPATPVPTRTLPVQSDVAITQRHSPNPTAADGRLTYALDIVNQGTALAEGVIVTDTLPAQVTLLTATGVFSQDASLVWELGTLAPNEHRQLFIETHVHTDVVRAFTNVATVSSTSPEDNLANNRSARSTSVTRATDLALTTLTLPSRVGAGETFTGVLDYDNFGPAHVDALTVALHLPPELHFGGTVTTTPPLDFMPGGPAVSPGTLLIANTRPVGWSAAQMPALSAGRVVFTLTATPSMTGTVTYTIHITSTTPEVQNANNIRQRTLSIVPVADLALTVTPSSPSVIDGETLTYTLNYTNHGPWVARNVRLLYMPPPGLDLHTPINWTLPQLASGSSGSQTITATASITTRCPVSLAVMLRSTTRDVVLDNNRVVVTTSVQQADVALHSYVTPSYIVPNMPFTYTIVLTNTGDVAFPLQTLSLSGTLPMSLTYQAEESQVDLSDPRILKWQNVATFAPGHVLTLTLVPSATDLALGTYMHVLTATVSMAGIAVGATDMASVTVAAPVLAVGQHVSHTLTGDASVQTITVTTYITNTGLSPIRVLPMRMVYSDTVLRFDNATRFPTSLPNAGMLAWDNVLPHVSDVPVMLPINGAYMFTTTFLMPQSEPLPELLTYKVQISGATDVYQNRLSDVSAVYVDWYDLLLPFVIQK